MPRWLDIVHQDHSGRAVHFGIGRLGGELGMLRDRRKTSAVIPIPISGQSLRIAALPASPISGSANLS